jgi:hypothetical protein
MFINKDCQSIFSRVNLPYDTVRGVGKIRGEVWGKRMVRGDFSLPLSHKRSRRKIKTIGD